MLELFISYSLEAIVIDLWLSLRWARCTFVHVHIITLGRLFIFIIFILVKACQKIKSLDKSICMNLPLSYLAALSWMQLRPAVMETFHAVVLLQCNYPGHTGYIVRRDAWPPKYGMHTYERAEITKGDVVFVLSVRTIYGESSSRMVSNSSPMIWVKISSISYMSTFLPSSKQE